MAPTPNYPPFLNAPGLITKILEKIKEAKAPERFTQDYLATVLGFSGGSAKPFIPFAKRVGLLASDGAPTELYHQFRNPHHSKRAAARALKTGYAALYERNENAHKLDRKGLEGLIMQTTGLDAGSTAVRAIAASFENLRAFADFTHAESLPPKNEENPPIKLPQVSEAEDGVALNLAYTINLVLPKTDDVAVFNAIFRALREHLLRK